MFKKLMNTLHVLVCAVLVFQLIGCGTIMYPERKGQKAGKIDAGVAILDGIGLLFFLIPGIIAFAVDFNNGTIYLPSSFLGSLDLDDLKQVKFDHKNSTAASIEKIIQEQTGTSVTLDYPEMILTKLRSTDDMIDQFALILPSMPERIALSIKD